MRARPFGIDREHLARIRDALVQAPRLAGGERQTIGNGLEKKTFTLKADANAHEVKDHRMGIRVDFSIPGWEDHFQGHLIEVTVVE